MTDTPRKLSETMRTTLEALHGWENILGRGTSAGEIDAAGGSRSCLRRAIENGWAISYGSNELRDAPVYRRTKAGTERLRQDGWEEVDPEPTVYVRIRVDGEYVRETLQLAEACTSVEFCVRSDQHEVTVDGRNVHVLDKQNGADCDYEFPTEVYVPEIAKAVE
ncbi:hypothetical protein [Nocardia jiangxiensis]|uniref:hypothetical protein n=1 Tax=Nocardia jiangxiensis TaxID=282685 RepID=UPI0005940C1D|nr:hypothetical protein [Nocardia jiangxiensis]